VNVLVGIAWSCFTTHCSGYPNRLGASRLADQVRTCWNGLLKWLFAELEITIRAIESDLEVTLLSMGIFVLSSSLGSMAVTVPHLIRSCLLCQLYALPYITWICFLSQARSKEEDRLEKPHRPVPMGLVSERGASIRALVWAIAYLGISILLGLQKWAVLWILASVYHTWLGGDVHWFTKNFVNLSVGVAAQLGAVWDLTHGSWPVPAQTFVAGVSVWIGILGNIADFRDEQGDRLVGRKTLPVLYGARARAMVSAMAVGFGCLTVPALLTLRRGPAQLVFALLLSLWHFVIAWRLWFCRTNAADKRTYKFHLCLLYCTVLASAALFIG